MLQNKRGVSPVPALALPRAVALLGESQGSVPFSGGSQVQGGWSRCAIVIRCGHSMNCFEVVAQSHAFAPENRNCLVGIEGLRLGNPKEFLCLNTEVMRRCGLQVEKSRIHPWKYLRPDWTGFGAIWSSRIRGALRSLPTQAILCLLHVSGILLSLPCSEDLETHCCSFCFALSVETTVLQMMEPGKPGLAAAYGGKSRKMM